MRIRKNFLTKEEAAAEKATLEIRAVQVSAGFRPAMTLLTDAQLRDAEASWHRLQGRPQPLSFYVDFALANYRPPELQKPLAEAVKLYLAERTKVFEHDMLSMRELRSIRNELEALQTHFPKATVCQFTAPILRAYLERGDSVLKTYNNRRGVRSPFRAVASATLASTHRAKSTGEIRRAGGCNEGQPMMNDRGETGRRPRRVGGSASARSPIEARPPRLCSHRARLHLPAVHGLTFRAGASRLRAHGRRRGWA